MNFKSILTAGFLILLNTVPLVGVALHDWSLYELIVLYWVENLIVGLFVYLRMFCGRIDSSKDYFYPALIGTMYIGVYFVLCFFHAIALEGLFGSEIYSVGDAEFLEEYLTPLIAIIVIQILQWWHHDVKHSTTKQRVDWLVWLAFKRIVVLHLTIILGGILVQEMHEPFYGLVTLVFVKTVFDLLQLRKDKKLAAQSLQEQLDRELPK